MLAMDLFEGKEFSRLLWPKNDKIKFRTHRNVPFPCFKYLLPLWKKKKSSHFGFFFCLIRGCSLSWIMQLGMSERREGWLRKKKKKKKTVRQRETKQIEVRDRSLPGKREKHDLRGHILILSLKPWNTERLQDYRSHLSVPSPPVEEGGWPAMHDNHPHRNLLPLPPAAYPDK